MNGITKILLSFIVTSVVLILMLSISELTGKKPANTTINERYEIPDNCAEVPTKVIGFRLFYGTVCYEGNGLFLEVGFEGMPDSIYVARVQAVKDSLRNEFEGW